MVRCDGQSKTINSEIYVYIYTKKHATYNRVHTLTHTHTQTHRAMKSGRKRVRELANMLKLF